MDEIVLRGTTYIEDIPLSERERLFVEEYAINGFNGNAAALAAGYSAKSHNSAHRLLRSPKVRAAIEVRYKDHVMSADEVLARLTEQARGDYGNYIDNDGSVNIEQLKADGKAHLIKSISDSKYGVRIEFYDSQKAMAIMGKYHRLFAERIENITFDMARLSNRQLTRLSRGDKLIDVLLDREEYDVTIDGESQTVEKDVKEIPEETEE